MSKCVHGRQPCQRYLILLNTHTSQGKLGLQAVKGNMDLVNCRLKSTFPGTCWYPQQQNFSSGFLVMVHPQIRNVLTNVMLELFCKQLSCKMSCKVPVAGKSGLCSAITVWSMQLVWINEEDNGDNWEKWQKP